MLHGVRSSPDGSFSVEAGVSAGSADEGNQRPAARDAWRDPLVVDDLVVSCFRPRRLPRGRRGIGETGPRGELVASLMVPCGSCVGCRAAHAADWALRCVHEAECNSENSFITLTYDDDHVPGDGSVRVAVLQQFVRRLRKSVPGRVRYFACGEYGEKTWRPHYHAAVFGHAFSDRFAQLRERPPLFRSKLLEKLWVDEFGKSLGHSSVGELTYESAAYVARYVMKKLTGLRAEEYGGRKPPFVVMSLKPGIGARWFEKYKSDVFPADEIVHDGRKHRVPRYYDKLFSELCDEEMERIKARREAEATKRPEELTDRRMRVREGVAEARLRAFRRAL